jgi:hypothetical protein
MSCGTLTAANGGTVKATHGIIRTGTWNKGPNTQWQTKAIGGLPVEKTPGGGGGKTMPGSLVTYQSNFHGEDQVILLLIDYETLDWLISQFGQFAQTAPLVTPRSFIIGDGNPVESERDTLVSVRLVDWPLGNQLIQAEGHRFIWWVSRVAAGRFSSLLAGMLRHEEAEPPNLRALGSAAPLEGGCHQYLDPDNAPPVPVVMVSLGEYHMELFRHRD